MKTLKQLRKIQEAGADDYVVDPDDDEEALEYQPRSDGEIEFVDLHSVEVSNHPAAPEDQHVAKTSHNKHKGAEHPGEPVVKQGTSGDVKFAKFREKITKTPLRKGDKRQGDFKAGSVKEEVDLDEKVQFEAPTKDKKGTFQVIDRDTKGMPGTQDKFKMQIVDKRGKVLKDWGSHPSLDGAKKFAKNKGIIEEVELEEVEFIDEAVKAGTIKLENGKSVKVTKEDADAFNAVLKELNPENRKRMESEMMKDEKSYKNMLTFAKRTM